MENFTLKWIATTEETPWENMKTVFTTQSQDTLELTGEKYQTIEGFGGCFNEQGWDALSCLEESEKDKVFEELFHPEKGCKFNFCRLPVGANDYSMEWYSYNENDGDYAMDKFSIERDRHYLIPYIRRAQKYNPDIKFFASPWSPPSWMKFPKVYNYGTLIWDKKILEAYALYFLKFVKAYESEGIKISQIHVQNEPLCDQKFPSCKWTGEELNEFIRDYIGPLFEKEGLDTDVWLGTINGPEEDNRLYDNYVNLVLSDIETRKYVKGVGFQWSGKYILPQTYASWPEVKLMQTENECGDGKNTWEYARHIFNLFRHYLSNGVSNYTYWNMILKPGGSSTWGWTQNSMITIDPSTKKVIYNPEFYITKHFTHYINKGAVRLGIKGHWSGNSVAFENPDGSIIVSTSNAMAKERNFTFKWGEKEFTVVLKPYSINTFEIK